MLKSNKKISWAMTLTEMMIALAIMAVVFVAIVPQIRSIQNSWASKRANAEVIHNGAALMDHITFNLTQAQRIVDVSGPGETNGYIEFEDNDSNIMRYQIGANNYVQFGPPASLSDLAGPVSQLRFTCYDACDLDTVITDVDQIRCVEAQATLTNSAPLGQDRTFITEAYIRTNTIDVPIYKEPASVLEFNVVLGEAPDVCKIDDTHYLCVYAGPGNDGWAVIIEVDTTNWTLSKKTPFEFDTNKGQWPALVQIDATHYLCAYTGHGNHGYAVVLTVNPASWTVSKEEEEFRFDPYRAVLPSLSKIDDSHYLCAYEGKSDDGWAVVLTVDTDDWEISKGTAVEYDTHSGKTPALQRIDSTHYLCVYEGQNVKGTAVVFTVNPGTWTITTETSTIWDSVKGQSPVLCQIDSQHYLCAYAGLNDNGWAAVLTVGTGTWAITAGTPFQYDANKSVFPALEKENGNRYLCVYEGPNLDAWANILTVNTATCTVGKYRRVEYDPQGGETPCLARIDDNHYLCIYQGANDDGWAAVLNTNLIRP